MARPTVRLYGLKPTDIQVRRAAAPADEVLLFLGEDVAIQGLPAHLKILMKLGTAQVARIEQDMADAQPEPF